MASFNTTLSQMTKMFQCPKYLSKKRLTCFSERKQTPLLLFKNFLWMLKYCHDHYFLQNVLGIC